MRYLNFATPLQPNEFRLGEVQDGWIIDVDMAWRWYSDNIHSLPSACPPDVDTLLCSSDGVWERIPLVIDQILNRLDIHQEEYQNQPLGYSLQDIKLGPPIRRPPSIRDFYAFEQHVKTARQIRGAEIPEEWYQIPVFYFSNPNAVYGPEQTIPYPVYTHELDYELEIACIIRHAGKNISPDEVENYIGGYTIFNDWSARDIQRIETRVGLGPAKGKDFASSLGPWLVTPDELKKHATGRPGVFSLNMKACVNGLERSIGNFAEIFYSFGELCARASADTRLVPGDVIASGTVGTGCLLEITRGLGPWLQPGDRVELEIDGLGTLANQVGVPGQN